MTCDGNCEVIYHMRLYQTLILAVLVLILGLFWMYHWKVVQAMKLGYEQRQSMSSESYMWVKATETK